jgi:hypothetical protein
MMFIIKSKLPVKFMSKLKNLRTFMIESKISFQFQFETRITKYT